MSPLDFVEVNGCEVCNGSSTDREKINYIIGIFKSHANGRVLSIEDLFQSKYASEIHEG